MVRNRTMVMGVGNILLADEGAGIHILKELGNYDLPAGTELLEGGTAGMNLLNHMAGVDHLIIVDSINAAAEPGSIFKFRPGDISVIPEEVNVSSHQMGLMEVLKMGETLGKLPQTVVIYGIQPKSLDWGLDLTAEVKGKLTKLAEMVVKELWTFTD